MGRKKSKKEKQKQAKQVTGKSGVMSVASDDVSTVSSQPADDGATKKNKMESCEGQQIKSDCKQNSDLDQEWVMVTTTESEKNGVVSKNEEEEKQKTTPLQRHHSNDASLMASQSLPMSMSTKSTSGFAFHSTGTATDLALTSTRSFDNEFDDDEDMTSASHHASKSDEHVTSSSRDDVTVRTPETIQNKNHQHDITAVSQSVESLPRDVTRRSVHDSSMESGQRRVTLEHDVESSLDSSQQLLAMHGVRSSAVGVDRGMSLFDELQLCRTPSVATNDGTTSMKSTPAKSARSSVHFVTSPEVVGDIGRKLLSRASLDEEEDHQNEEERHQDAHDDVDASRDDIFDDVIDREGERHELLAEYRLRLQNDDVRAEEIDDELSRSSFHHSVTSDSVVDDVSSARYSLVDAHGAVEEMESRDMQTSATFATMNDEIASRRRENNELYEKMTRHRRAGKHLRQKCDDFEKYARSLREQIKDAEIKLAASQSQRLDVTNAFTMTHTPLLLNSSAQAVCLRHNVECQVSVLTVNRWCQSESDLSLDPTLKVDRHTLTVETAGVDGNDLKSMLSSKQQVEDLSGVQQELDRAIQHIRTSGSVCRFGSFL